MNIKDNLFLKAFGAGARQFLIDMAHYETLDSDVCLFEEDDPADAVYLVLRGEVELTKKTDRDHREVIARVGEGDYFGEMGVIDKHGRSTGAYTTCETELAKIPAAPLLGILSNEPSKVSLTILQHISEHLRATNSLLIEEVLRKERLHVVGEMASSIIHDFKNPMFSIELAADLISMKNPDKKIADYCQRIRKHVERMAAMAQELLDYSRGSLQITKERVTVNDLFNEVELLNADYLREKNVAFSFKGINAVVEVDRSRMLRVLQNLLSNAVEAPGPDGGRISFTAAKKDKKTVELRVSDNGTGIPEEIQDTLFEPFVTIGKREGTGLGLAVAKTVVEAHEGDISFISKEGKGTTFVIHLPLGSG